MDSNLGEIIQSSLENIREIVDVNTIIGDPIHTTGGTVIIPVSKISLGFVSGGVDYTSKNNKQAESHANGSGNANGNGKSASANSAKPKNFGGGGGTGVTIAPVGFLVVKCDGDVELLNLNCPDYNNNLVGSITDLLEKSPEIISRLKEAFKG